MAIGDDLVRQGGFVGPISFTPDMQKAGIQLLPSAATPPGTFGSSPDFGSRPPSNPSGLPSAQRNVPLGLSTKNDLSVFHRMSGLIPRIPSKEAAFQNLQRRQRRGNEFFPESESGRAPSAQSTFRISPDDVRPRNPFDPSQRVIPEDDALTPEGVLAPSEIKEQGNMLSKLGDFLSNPAGVKFLAALGMQILPENTALGEFAMAQAESNAQQMFQERLEAGESAGDIIIPGLSAEGRAKVQERFEQSQMRQAEQDIARQREERLGAEESRLGQMAEANIAFTRARTEQINLENEALRAANAVAGEEGEAFNPNQMLEAGAKVLGISIPQGVDMSSFSRDQTYGILRELSAIRQRQISMGERPSRTGIPEVTEAMRSNAVKAAKIELADLEQQFASAESASDRVNLRNRIADLRDRLVEMGEDPFDTQQEGGKTAGPIRANTPLTSSNAYDVGTARIQEISPFTREEIMEMTPEQRKEWILAWMNQNQR